VKVYLAGKMDDAAGSWRNAILGMPWGAKGPRARWVQEVQAPDWNGSSVQQWHTIRGVVLEQHDYVGPFRQTFTCRCSSDCDEHRGVAHGSAVRGSHGEANFEEVHALSLQICAAITAADLVFAYINRPDSYGTIAEIGYAAALGKFVWLHVDPDALFDGSDLQVVRQFATGASYLYGHPRAEGESARNALKDAFVAYAAWQPTQRQTAIIELSRQGFARTEAVNSFEQIAQWTSDPRVRDEARRMVRRLSS
jgi:hypothetical protein